MNCGQIILSTNPSIIRKILSSIYRTIGLVIVPTNHKLNLPTKGLSIELDAKIHIELPVFQIFRPRGSAYVVHVCLCPGTQLPKKAPRPSDSDRCQL